MFTGIIESMATVKAIREEGTNRHFTLEAEMAAELKIDQSVAHDGVCLTVVAIEGNTYTVTAVEETLQRTNLGRWAVGGVVNGHGEVLVHAEHRAAEDDGEEQAVVNVLIDRGQDDRHADHRHEETRGEIAQGH